MGGPSFYGVVDLVPSPTGSILTACRLRDSRSGVRQGNRVVSRTLDPEETAALLGGCSGLLDLTLHVTDHSRGGGCRSSSDGRAVLWAHWLGSRGPYFLSTVWIQGDPTERLRQDTAYRNLDEVRVNLIGRRLLELSEGPAATPLSNDAARDFLLGFWPSTTLTDLLPPLRSALQPFADPGVIRERLTRLEGHPPAVDPEAARLVVQMGSEHYSERETAYDALRRRGASSVGALLAGLESERMEVRSRCSRILRGFWNDVLTACRGEGTPESRPAGKTGGTTPLKTPGDRTTG